MSQLKQEDRKFVLGMLSPTVFVFIAGVFFPLAYGIYLSFFYTDRFNQSEKFVLFGNYIEFLFGRQSVEFYRVYANTIIFTIVTVFFELILGLSIALIINKSFKGRGIVRAAILIPWAIPTIVNAQLWRFMFAADNSGLANDIFKRLGLIEAPITFTTEGDRILINYIFLITIVLFLVGIVAVLYNLLRGLYNRDQDFLKSRSFLILVIVTGVSSIFAIFLPILMGVDNLYGFSGILGKEPLTIKMPSAMIIVFLIDIWKTTPFMALLILASLQTIPQDLYKAASVDGATSFQQFRNITLPLIMPGIGVALIFRCIDAFRVYDILAVFGLNVIESVTSLAVNQTKFGYYGSSASIAIITFINILVFTILFFYLTRRSED